MSNDQFIERCKAAVQDYFNSHAEKTDNVLISTDDVYVVWLCKTLQNNKALLSTTVPDGMYYEVTYNGDKHEMYVDVYKKWENFAIKE
ncbi:MAG: hypothetical protein HFE91_05805 [Acutalibacter sp.]|jgi:hypothetical protein|uniref:DUF6275 family protein n=1 Tax=Acutalibacter sp. TaxID=1918636 RepID=UPI002172AFBB|nr:DUF6275 family protein [Acutalibacter sp.]MCI9224962.1 hypothetical protein [Acutalibacter sp.]